ncbi:pyridoxine 5'-phosphate synthase [bacterium SCSIO 12643]|nr:pyridoxine 5'-phosphate synthase [bacterium SCSIO 12643]
MTQLSVNVNKVATIRNARGGNIPNVLQVALDCEKYGAQGITVHPRPDQRHIRFTDVEDLANSVTTEFNIEGYPSSDFIQMVLKHKPAQVTLVPDGPDVLTSNAGWNTVKHHSYLKTIIDEFKDAGIRTSIFIDADNEMIEHASLTNTDRIELYTEDYAQGFASNKEEAIAPYISAAETALKHSLGINAGHDLNLDNLKYFASNIPNLLEVSIGHALISDALYYGLENTIALYLRELRF